nr:hypothetical transcript [Hymenolepis microstoma]
MLYFQRLLICLQTILSLVLAYLSTVQTSCQFPEFLLLPSTNIWWSGPVFRPDSTSSFFPFAQLTVRGDLRKMILSYLLDSSTNSTHYPFNRYPFKSHLHGISNYTVPAIHIDLRCDQLIDKATETYLAEIHLTNSRSLYICMRFYNLDRTGAPEVFELIQGDSMTTSSDCSTSNNLHRSIWIPNLSKYDSGNHQKICPLVGGFQAKNFINLNSNSPICNSSVYVTIDSECIRGEGIEFHFNEPGCNPFESTLMTRFSCFVQWTESGSLFTILMKEKSPNEYIVLSMFYNEQPSQVDRANNEYGSFSKVSIGLGIFRPIPESTKDVARRLYPEFLYELESLDTNLKTSPLTLYEVLIRGACEPLQVSKLSIPNF